ncbi:MAG: hypothetical protein ACXVAX_03415 [Pseudobdellovibrio sp.]
MNLAGNLKNLSTSVQQGARNASISLTQRALRLVTGFFIGLVLALIIQEFTQNGTLVLLFLTSLGMFITYRILRSFSLWQIVIFDVFCILIANTLRMYIMMAP